MHRRVALRLDRGAAADIPLIMAVERIEGFDEWVGRWDEARHRDALGDGRHAYFVARDEVSEAVGFGIVRDWNSPERSTLIKRVAVRQPGRGNGRILVGLVADAVFALTDAHRLAIGAFPENERAIRAYEAAGFQREGVARGSAYFAGRYRDELMLSMLRPEWAERRAVT